MPSSHLAFITRRFNHLLLAAFCLHALHANGGGSGLSTLVVVNASSPDSLAVGNHYCESRQVPPENLLRINWAGSNQLWSSNDFVTHLWLPVQHALTASSSTNVITHVVLSIGIPYQTFLDPSNVNSTTSALFYGLKRDFGTDPGETNSYAFSETAFCPIAAPTPTQPAILATMLTANDLSQVQSLVSRSVASDRSIPRQPVVLAKSSDPNRNVRHYSFDHTLLNIKILDRSLAYRTNSDTVNTTNLFGYQTGLQQFSIAPGTFAAGAIADSMSSFGGLIFGPNSQSNLLNFIAGGAAGSYGTVAEPYADASKFPNPAVYFYQARGFDLAESYYLSLQKPYLGLIVGDPLSAPFAQSANVDWVLSPTNSILTGPAALRLVIQASELLRPLQQVDLFVDGRFFRTITNIPPTAGNVIQLRLNGYPISYTVTSNATLSSLAAALATKLNEAAVTNLTQIQAIAYGDRIELSSLRTDPGPSPFFLTYPTNALAASRVSYLPANFPPQLLALGRTKTDRFQIQLGVPNTVACIIQASTNLISWQPIHTNIIPGLTKFEDVASTQFPQRFYRLSGNRPDQPPSLSIVPPSAADRIRMIAQSNPGQSCAILTSSDSLSWSPIFTNLTGGEINYEEAIDKQTSRFFRASLVTPPSPTLSTSLLDPQTTLLRVDNPVQPFQIEGSLNNQTWIGLVTNMAFRDIQLEAGTTPGPGGQLSTYARAAQPTFLTLENFGIQSVTFFAGTMTTGAWARIIITKTNGNLCTVASTNLTAGLNATNLGYQIYTSINNTPGLQGEDGVIAEDFYVNSGGQAKFTVRARSPGLNAALAGIRAESSGFSTGVSVSPGSFRRLTQNLYDLQPRNHLYITAGAERIDTTTLLDTADLTDGYHELTAVAYEGSHVRTQTHATIPVCISNSPLAATLTLIDLTNNAPANASYHLQVTANTNNVTRTTLYSTGGVLAIATNQPTATFTIHGTNLWIGRHPFYALVETASGQKYRTATSWIRLQ